jgi:hypothetical protein
MNTLYYYFRGENKVPRITVCLLYEIDLEGVKLVARGLAICSLKETPCKKKGRDLAYTRALEAVTLGNNLRPISKENRKVLAVINSITVGKGQAFIGTDCDYKSVTCPWITPFENKMLDKVKKNGLL